LNYFKLANIHGKLQALESWLRNGCGTLFGPEVFREKKPERKRKNLMRLGVNPEDTFS
jgi:hypothetical protein